MNDGDAVFQADDGANRRVLMRARTVAAALVLGVLAFIAVSGILPRVPSLGVLVLPAAAFGAISPVFGYRLYLLLRERIAPGASAAECRATFLRAVVLALAVTDAAAVFGVLVHALTGDLLVLIGAFMHVLLAGAIWPTEDRLQLFLDAATRSGG
jgi:hypothetical protein